MHYETEIIPYHLSPPLGEKVLVLAPHPDDETFGCGGTVRLLIESGKTVKIVFLTSGDKGDPEHPAAMKKHEEDHITDYSLMREKEAVRALKRLGVSDYEFLRFPDRELDMHFDAVRERVYAITTEYLPDTIYSPSEIELNPDHRTTAKLSFWIQRKTAPALAGEGKWIRLIFYEVTTPFRPNMLVDITAVFGRKKRAMKKYASQLRSINFIEYITALNTVRALTVHAGHVEAFWVMEQPLDDEEKGLWLTYQAVLQKG
jgi:LmbE family N-acetylglucosaminyl deacetylase